MGFSIRQSDLQGSLKDHMDFGMWFMQLKLKC